MSEWDKTLRQMEALKARYKEFGWGDPLHMQHIDACLAKIYALEAERMDISPEYCHACLDSLGVPREDRTGMKLNFYGRAVALKLQAEAVLEVRIAELERDLHAARNRIDDDTETINRTCARNGLLERENAKMKAAVTGVVYQATAIAELERQLEFERSKSACIEAVDTGVVDELEQSVAFWKGDAIAANTTIRALERALVKARSWMFCGEDETTSRQEQYHRDLALAQDALSLPRVKELREVKE